MPDPISRARARRLAALAERSDEAIVGIDEQQRVSEWSVGAERLFGWTRAEMIGQSVQRLEPEERRGEVAKLVARAAKGETIRRFETVRQRKDGTGVEIATTILPLRDETGRPDGAWAILDDIGARRQTQRHVAYVERGFAIVEGISAALAHGEGLPQIAAEACRVAVERGGLRMAWIGEVDHERGVKPLAHAGHEDGYLAANRFAAHTGLAGQGPTGRSVREGRAVVCADIATDPVMAPWREAALARGYRSSASLPIYRGKEVVAVMGLYAPEPDFFTLSSLRMLSTIANLLGCATSQR